MPVVHLLVIANRARAGLHESIRLGVVVLVGTLGRTACKPAALIPDGVPLLY
jgi:hypothetical protein